MHRVLISKEQTMRRTGLESSQGAGSPMGDGSDSQEN